jgi:hypothetical protein
MSPVDSSAADSSTNTPKTEREVGKNRGSEVLVEADASNAAQPKLKKKKTHDVKTPEVVADGAVSELPQETSSVVNGHRKSKKSKEGSKVETEPSLAPEKDRGEKKSKKRKRKEDDGDRSNAVEQLEATSNEPHDEKRAKKRKHKEKREDGSPSKQNDVPDEETGVVATNGEEVKEKTKKRRKSKAGVENGDEIVEKTRKKRKKSESQPSST